MRKFFMLLAVAGIISVSSTSAYANDEAEAAIKACEQQTQGAPDPSAALMQCLDEKAQYETE